MNGRLLRAEAGRRLASGSPKTIVVEVLDARGSAPRDAGTRMLVDAERSAGTIGGGHLELQALTLARRLLSTDDGTPRRVRYPLGPALGQCCGGDVTLAFAPLDAALVERWPSREPLCRVQLHGAGHVGRAIATLLATLDCEVDWFDQRDDGFPPATALGSPWPAHVRRTAIDTVEAEVRHAPPGAFYLVVTHEHAIDLRIVEAVLRRGDFAYLGLIGSKTKRARFVHRLREGGLAEGAIARMTCPIGVDGVEGKEPEVIAAVVVAQLLQVATAATRRSQKAPG